MYSSTAFIAFLLRNTLAPDLPFSFHFYSLSNKHNQSRINRYAKYAMAGGSSARGPPWRQKLLFHTSISLVTEPMFACCFQKISMQ